MPRATPGAPGNFQTSGSSTEVNITNVGGSPVTLGQKTMANSFPVVVASDQSTLPVSISGTVTVTGTVAATQSGTWNITNISGTVSLPTGAATSANQTTIIGHVDGIETLLSNIASDTDSLAVVGGGVEATALRVTIASDSTGLVSIDDNGGSLTVDGTVAVSSVGGTVAVTQSGTWDEVGINDSGNSITVDAPVGTPVFVRLSDGSAAITKLSTSVSGFAASDGGAGFNTIFAYGAGDTDSASDSGLVVNARHQFYNGSSWTRARGSSTDGLLVNLGSNNDVTVTGTVSGTGTAGSAATGVVTIQGIASMTPVQVGDNSSSLTVDNGGTFAVQVDGAALTSLQLIDDTVFTDDNAFTPATSKVSAVGYFADETSTDSVDEGDIGAARMTLDRKQIVTIYPHTANGLSTFMASGSDGSSILTNAAQAIKASAGQVYGYFIYNPNSSAQFVHFYNTAAASVTVGTTNPLFTLTIPATSGANLMSAHGIQFTNAGFSISATATAGGNGAPSTGLDAVVWYN